jgi:hypothetical protein
MESDPGPFVNPTWSLATRALEMERQVSARRATIDGDSPLSPTRAHPPLMTGSNPVYVSASTNSSEITLIDSQTKTPESDHDVMVLDDDQPETGLERDPMDPEAMPLLGPEEPEAPRRLPPMPPRTSKTPVIDLTGESDGEVSRTEDLQKPPVPARPVFGPPNKPGAEAPDEGPSRVKAEAAAQQQDVAEAMDNVLFKLRCSIYNDPPEDGRVADRIEK